MNKPLHIETLPYKTLKRTTARLSKGKGKGTPVMGLFGVFQRHNH